MLTVGSASQLEFCTRAAAVEVLLTLAERAPAIMRKCSTAASGLLPLTLSLACEVGSFSHLVDIYAQPGGKLLQCWTIWIYGDCLYLEGLIYLQQLFFNVPILVCASFQGVVIHSRLCCVCIRARPLTG